MSFNSVSTPQVHTPSTENTQEDALPDSTNPAPEVYQNPHQVKAVAEQLQGRTWVGLGDVFFRPTADKKAATIRAVQQSAAGMEADPRMADLYSQELVVHMEARDPDDYRPEKIVQTFTAAFRAASRSCTERCREAA